MSKQNHPARWKIPFFTIWTGQVFSLSGSRLAQFALVWWLTESTGSATVLATATLVAVLPGIILGPLAGALVDRWNRRLIMIAADGFVALVSLGLAILFWQGLVQVWHIYLAMMARSLGEAFHWPSMQASTSLMVPKEQLSRVSGLNQTLRGMLNVVAPPLGALLMTLLPLHGIMGIDVVTATIAICPLFFVRIPQPQPANTENRASGGSLWADIRCGFRYLANWPGAIAIVIIAMIINFVINPAFSLMPLLVANHFQGGALELGWLESAWGIGLVAGGILLSLWGGFQRRIYTSLSGLIVGGLGIMFTGLAPARNLELALVGLLIAGFCNPLINGPFWAIMQSTVAPEMQGRIFTLVGSLTSAMMPLSLAVAGPLSDLIGLRAWYVAGGIIFSGMGIISFAIPAVVHLEDRNTQTQPSIQVQVASTTG